jgi:5'(3')-deoxyribonucleotidase
MKCLVDMDGVITDFATGLFKANCLDVKDFDLTGHWWLHKACASDQTEFEKPCHTPEFWENLRFTPEAFQIIEAVEDKYGTKNVYLCTSPSDWPAASFGKHKWILKNLPEYRRRFFIGDEKWAIASPSLLLVDDRDDNVDNFRRAGGQAILVPRPWNRHHKLHTMAYVLEELDRL